MRPTHGARCMRCAAIWGRACRRVVAITLAVSLVHLLRHLHQHTQLLCSRVSAAAARPRIHQSTEEGAQEEEEAALPGRLRPGAAQRRPAAARPGALAAKVAAQRRQEEAAPPPRPAGARGRAPASACSSAATRRPACRALHTRTHAVNLALPHALPRPPRTTCSRRRSRAARAPARWTTRSTAAPRRSAARSQSPARARGPRARRCRHARPVARAARARGGDGTAHAAAALVPTGACGRLVAGWQDGGHPAPAAVCVSNTLVTKAYVTDLEMAAS